MTTNTPRENVDDATPIARMRSLLEPTNVAVVGASSTEGKQGHALLANVAREGFDGNVYPVNPNADEILGLECYPDLAMVPEPLDTVVFAVPGHIITDVLPTCGDKGVDNVVIVAAGFAEAVTDEGPQRQQEIADLCAEHDLTVVGPNTTGMASMKSNFVGSIEPFPRWHDGPIAIAGQSGIFAGVYMQELMARDVRQLGYNYSLALGNKIDVDETDFVRFAGQDDAVEVIQLHLESIRNPDEFFPVAARVARETPIILLKTGRTTAGRAAARWHTASTPTVDEEVETARRAAGIIRASTLPQFTDYATGFAAQPAPQGRNVGVVSLSGGNAVMAADAIAESVLEVASPTRDTLERIKDLGPEWQPIRNPVDALLAVATSGPREGQEVPLRALLADENVDAVVTVHLASELPDFDGIAEMYTDARAAHPTKPVLTYVMGAEPKRRWIRAIDDTDVPVFDSATAAIDTLAAMYRWRRYADGTENYDPDVTAQSETI